MAIFNSVQNNTRKSGLALVELVLSVLAVLSTAILLAVRWGSDSTTVDALLLTLTVTVAGFAWSSYRGKKR